MGIVFTKRSGAPDKTIIAAYNESNELLPRGMAINIYNSGQRACARRADYSSFYTLCHGFTVADIEPNSWGEIQTFGPLEILIDAIPGTNFFLKDNGNIIEAAPDAPYNPILEDKIIQMVGYAISSSKLYIKIERPIAINLPLETELEAPILVSPHNNSVVNQNTVHFDWLIHGATPDYYNIQISEDVDFTKIKINEETNNTFISLFIPNGTYYWRVAGIDNYGSRSEWSDIWQFEVIS